MRNLESAPTSRQVWLAKNAKTGFYFKEGKNFVVERHAAQVLTQSQVAVLKATFDNVVVERK